MAARIEYKASVARDLRKLGQGAAVRVLRTVARMLASEGHKGEALSGVFTGLYTLRVGDYRVIYARIEGGYLALRIGHREDVYSKGRPEVK